MHRMKIITGLISALTIMGLLAACGSDPTATPQPALPTATPQPTATPIDVQAIMEEAAAEAAAAQPKGATQAEVDAAVEKAVSDAIAAANAAAAKAKRDEAAATAAAIAAAQAKLDADAAAAAAANAPAATPTPDTSFEGQWKQLVADAQEEGQLVVILSGTLSRTGRPTLDFFSKRFDIEVIASSGSGAPNTNRLLAERGRGRYTVDISTVSGGSMERIRGAGALTPLAPHIIDPTILEDRSNWYYDEPVWMDIDQKYALANSISVANIAAIWYNTNNVSQAEIDTVQHYTDLLDPKWKGRMAMRAMNNPGGKSVFARLWLAPELGPTYLDQLHTQFETGDLVDSEADAALADGLAKGKWDLILWGCGQDCRALKALGLPVEELTSTRVLAPGMSTELSGSHAIVDQAPHPAAAALWSNWWLSQEGQATHRENLVAYGPQTSGTLRSDVGQFSTIDASWKAIQDIPAWRKAGTLEDNLIVFEKDDEWFTVRENLRDHFNKLYKELGFDAWVTYNY
jgi:ABC-type Fe3+ transport system substrate-binding protein